MFWALVVTAYCAKAGTARSRNIHQIERANVQLPYFRETSQGLDQDRRTRTGGSPAQAFEIRDAGHASARQESLQISALFGRADLA